MGYLPNKYPWTFNVVNFFFHPRELNEIWASFDIFASRCYTRLPCLLLYSPEQLVAGRIVAALMHVRAVKGMALFRPSIIAFLPLQSN